ncbi:uncharacterized protein RAG0_12949 [Rhynchosporium agropyri]|uniref:Uncharacterized protein n=1 Tax=Rhynchosporium agropyri TaxID=914238 RepID=A0A1E1LAQ1_9HELO|nr:uncharacterized protein RAG0_12949 [Rhynchosporium agropyri]
MDTECQISPISAKVNRNIAHSSGYSRFMASAICWSTPGTLDRVA